MMIDLMQKQVLTMDNKFVIKALFFYKFSSSCKMIDRKGINRFYLNTQQVQQIAKMFANKRMCAQCTLCFRRPSGFSFDNCD